MGDQLFDSLGILDGYAGVWKIFIRLLLATLAGIAIGAERKYRLKSAGIKTHSILCLTASLFMIISKYGFYEMLDLGVNYDVSRVASTIITGLCFLGTGLLVFKNENVKGLTTAIGLCLTVAVGMCFGAGLIIIGIFVTVFVVLLQIVLHLSIFKNKSISIARALIITEDNYVEKFKEIFNIKHFLKFRAFTQDGKIVAEIEFVYTNKIYSEDIYKILKVEDHILMFEKVEGN